MCVIISVLFISQNQQLEKPEKTQTLVFKHKCLFKILICVEAKMYFLSLFTYSLKLYHSFLAWKLKGYFVKYPGCSRFTFMEICDLIFIMFWLISIMFLTTLFFTFIVLTTHKVLIFVNIKSAVSDFWKSTKHTPNQKGHTPILLAPPPYSWTCCWTKGTPPSCVDTPLYWWLAKPHLSLFY